MKNPLTFWTNVDLSAKCKKRKKGCEMWKKWWNTHQPYQYHFDRYNIPPYTHVISIWILWILGGVPLLAHKNQIALRTAQQMAHTIGSSIFIVLLSHLCIMLHPQNLYHVFRETYATQFYCSPYSVLPC